VPVADILLFIDAIQVCTTCGWAEHLHTSAAAGLPGMNICAHYEREL